MRGPSSAPRAFSSATRRVISPPPQPPGSRATGLPAAIWPPSPATFWGRCRHRRPGTVLCRSLDVSGITLPAPPRECAAMKVLVTGGAGFIGSAACRLLVGELGTEILNVDKLTYAANLASL